MRRTGLLLLLATLPLRAAEPAGITVEPIPAPAAAGAIGASLVTGPDGNAWLSWLEPDGAAAALRIASFDLTKKAWNPARTITRGSDFFLNSADVPALTLGPNGHATLVWSVNNPPAATTASHATHDDDHGPGYHAVFSTTQDGGKTWSGATGVTTESDAVEFVSLATLADGRVLAAWLDGRAKKQGPGAQQLYARIIGGDGPDQLVDDSVCDCCQTSLAAFPDGSALVAYRGRTRDEVRDIRVRRFRAGHWEDAETLHDDHWTIAGCPVNGPQLASDGAKVAAAWFTAADGNPRVLTSISSDAGGRFLMPLRLDETKPAGRVGTVLLHDGAILVTSVDAAGGLWLRRVSPDFAPTNPVALSSPGQGRIKGFPRPALLRDYIGGTAPAQILVALVSDTAPALRTLLVTVPEAELLDAEKSCDCAAGGDPNDLRGYPVRGTLVAFQSGSATAQVRTIDLPGLFPAGEHTFMVDAEAAVTAGHVGRMFMGRAERRDGAWRLFAVRWIASPP